MREGKIQAKVKDVQDGAKVLSKIEGDIEICGNTSGVWIRSSSKIIPEPWAVGIWECLSPESQVIFMLDCYQ